MPIAGIPLSAITKQIRVMDSGGKLLRLIDRKLCLAGLQSGRYQILKRSGDIVLCVKDLYHRSIVSVEQSPALQSTYRDNSPTFMMKAAVGSRENFSLEKRDMLTVA